MRHDEGSQRLPSIESQRLRPDGYLLVNTNKGFDELHLAEVVAKLSNGHARAGDRTRLEAHHAQYPTLRCSVLLPP